jgi:hypothetical protein
LQSGLLLHLYTREHVHIWLLVSSPLVPWLLNWAQPVALSLGQICGQHQILTVRAGSTSTNLGQESALSGAVSLLLVSVSSLLFSTMCWKQAHA